MDALLPLVLSMVAAPACALWLLFLRAYWSDFNACLGALRKSTRAKILLTLPLSYSGWLLWRSCRWIWSSAKAAGFKLRALALDLRDLCREAAED